MILRNLLFLLILLAFGCNSPEAEPENHQSNQHTMLGLRTTIYKVPDLAKAKEWYSRAFNTQPYFDEPFYVGFNIGGYELGLLPDTAQTGDNVLTYWGVEHIQAEYERFIALGASEYNKPENVGGEIMTAAVRDPWNNVIGLIYNPEFELPE